MAEQHVDEVEEVKTPGLVVGDLNAADLFQMERSNLGDWDEAGGDLSADVSRIASSGTRAAYQPARTEAIDAAERGSGSRQPSSELPVGARVTAAATSEASHEVAAREATWAAGMGPVAARVAAVAAAAARAVAARAAARAVSVRAAVAAYTGVQRGEPPEDGEATYAPAAKPLFARLLVLSGCLLLLVGGAVAPASDPASVPMAVPVAARPHEPPLSPPSPPPPPPPPPPSLPTPPSPPPKGPPQAPQSPSSPPRRSSPPLDIGSARLSPEVCTAAFRDSHHLFRKMWNQDERERNHRGGKGCWDFRRDAHDRPQPARQFFDDIAAGRHCDSDWYAWSDMNHGDFRTPRAPALLGFDDDIHRQCGCERCCDGAGYNMLNLFGGDVQYNTCRNFEWQVCAALGKLPGQNSRDIVFARAPKTLQFGEDTWPTFGHCSGYTNTWCDWDHGFANADIFYLEVCLFSQVCSNADELFRVDTGSWFRCNFDRSGFDALREMLLEGPD